VPSQQQTFNDTPSPISQSVQIWGEGPEISPYATDFVPPSTFLPGVSVSGSNGSGTGTNAASTGSTSQTPDEYDLHWVAGDTAEFQFYFDGVCWTDVKPTDTLGLTWVMTQWTSQVRAEGWYYYGYWWPPTWPGYRYVMTFTITTEFLDDFSNLGPGTMVTLTGGTIWPGHYLWDLQTKQWEDPLLVDAWTTRTWLTGKATVDTQVTQPDLYPPSNWHVIPYA
jgi:hypothetical protein